jgi:cell division septal protein FtsQ
MDHQEQHHQHHRKEREHEKKEQKEHEREQEKQLRVIHPAWFVALGVVFIGLIVFVWTVLVP